MKMSSLHPTASIGYLPPTQERSSKEMSSLPMSNSLPILLLPVSKSRPVLLPVSTRKTSLPVSKNQCVASNRPLARQESKISSCGYSETDIRFYSVSVSDGDSLPTSPTGSDDLTSLLVSDNASSITVSSSSSSFQDPVKSITSGTNTTPDLPVPGVSHEHLYTRL